MNKSLVVGGGCFWGLEHLLKDFAGVTSTKVGYAGGDFDDPTYKDVCTGETGHAEAVYLEYDDSVTNLKDILHFFFRIHDPTTLNQQGNDMGTQYRSVIFYENEEEKKIAEEVIDEVNELTRFSSPVVTALQPSSHFYDAEEFHQNYLIKFPDGYNCHFIRK